jgi:hypothetical protein
VTIGDGLQLGYDQPVMRGRRLPEWFKRLNAERHERSAALAAPRYFGVEAEFVGAIGNRRGTFAESDLQMTPFEIGSVV